MADRINYIKNTVKKVLKYLIFISSREQRGGDRPLWWFILTTDLVKEVVLEYKWHSFIAVCCI